MRTAFFETLHALAARDDSIVLITGDLGFGVVEEFARSYPDRFHNAGVAEQDMTSIAAGLALTGSTVFTYSIANFPTLRCLEQIRNDVCYHRANVIVVSVGGGFSYGSLGMSHHATEDLGVMRNLPGLKVCAPGDPHETRAAVAELVRTGGPAYLRLGRAGEPEVHAGPVELATGTALEVRPGGDVALLSTGGMLATAVETAGVLAGAGIAARVLSVPWLAPLDTAAVEEAARTTRLVATIEEHSVTGGLGSAVSEVVASMRNHAPVLRIGVPGVFAETVGSQEYLRALYGLDSTSIAAKVEKAMAEARSE